jgi:D-sedoheptulose 7-phosphate isomerase
MDNYKIIADNFKRTIETIALSVDDLAGKIERGAQIMATALLADRKILACGNGVDAALAQLFVCNLLNRFEEDRPALPALTLGADHASITGIARDGSYNEIFSRQLRALGHAGDVLLCINSSAAAGNLARAVQTGQERNMGIIVMSNSLDDELGSLIRPEDVELRINATRRARIVEMHTMAIHNFCELIEHSLFGTYTPE